MPGPACYQRGGTRPTVTDADVVLGYLNPVALLGGKFPIDHGLAHQAIEESVRSAAGNFRAAGGARDLRDRQPQHGERHRRNLARSAGSIRASSSSSPPVGKAPFMPVSWRGN